MVMMIVITIFKFLPSQRILISLQSKDIVAIFKYTVRLLNSKIIRWNNDGYTYIGNSNNQLVKLANYSDVTNIKQPIVGQYTGTSEEKQYITLGFQPSYVFSCSLGGHITNGYESYFACATNISGNNAISITNNGFWIANAAILQYQIQLNAASYTYGYFCFA